jgi:hypothetical protein
MRSHTLSVALTLVNVALALGVGLGVLAAEPGGAGPAVPDVVQAHELQLVNADGDVVGQLYTGEDGSGQLRLRDADGIVRVKLGVGQDGGAGLVLFNGDAQPEPGVTAGSGDDGSRITLVDPDGDRRVLKP